MHTDKFRCRDFAAGRISPAAPAIMCVFLVAGPVIRDNGRMSAQMMTVAEVARELQCSAETVRRMIADKRLPAIQLRSGGSFRISVAAVRALIATP